jgi:hypothetical protein
MDVAATVAAKASLAVLGDSWDVEDGGANDHYIPGLRPCAGLREWARDRPDRSGASLIAGQEARRVDGAYERSAQGASSSPHGSAVV